MINEFIYNIANTKSYGHVMININDWITNDSLLCVNLQGKVLPTKITKVVKINTAPAYKGIPIKEGSVIALSAIATRIGLLRPFNIPNDSNDYANVHISQILGYFKDGIINIDNFKPLYDKVLLKKINIPISNFIDINDDSLSVGEVILTGEGGFDNEWNKRPMNVQVGQHVLIRDNISTSLTINGEEYYVISDEHIMGEFKDSNYDMENLYVLPNVHIFKEFEEETIAGSFLFKPVVDKNELEISQLYQDNIFELVKSQTLEKGVYYISRFDTEYIKFKGETYFVASLDKIMAKRPKEKINGKVSS